MSDLGAKPSAGPVDVRRIGVVLVNYRCLALIERQLNSGALSGTTVVLVDNASDPAELEALGRVHGARVVRSDRNTGFAGGVNLGVRALAGEDLDAYLLLNPDVSVSSEQIRALFASLRSSVSAAAAPVVLDDSGRPWVSTAGGPITLRAVAWYFLGVSHLLPWLSGFFWTRRQVRRGVQLRPRWLCGACLLIDARAWETYGQIPEDEIVYGEDVVWGNRCTSAGAELALVREVEVAHSGGASGGSDVWIDATARMFVREMGPMRGRVAGGVMRSGLVLRRLVRRVRRH